MKVVAKSLVYLSAVGIAIVALLSIVQSDLQSPIYRQLTRLIPWAGYTHLIAGSLALLLGGVQFSARIRRKSIGAHKLIGTLYVACVLASTIGAIASVSVSPSPWSAKSAFWTLAVLWPATTLLGYPWRGKFDVSWHARWMILSYALTCSAVSLRFILGITLGLGYAFSFAYPVAAWGGMVGNLLIALLIILASMKKVSGTD